MGKFIIGVVVGVVGLFAAVYIYFAAGMAPVATAASPMPLEKMFANMALEGRISKEMPKTVPVSADDATYAAGADIYKEHCEVCHGLPNGDQTAIAKGMFPKPPRLFHGMGVTDDPPGETYWKVSNGIRMSGMPAFDKALSTTQIWQVSVMLANADKVSESIKDSMMPPATPPATSTAPAKK